MVFTMKFYIVHNVVFTVMSTIPSLLRCLHCLANVKQQWQSVVDNEVNTDSFLMFFKPVELGIMQL